MGNRNRPMAHGGASADGCARAGHRRPFAALLPSLLLLAALPAAAATGDDAFPARGDWKATASSKQVAALAPEHAIDGDRDTRWGGSFSPGHWLQVDLGRAADVGGVAIHWEYGFAVTWTIETSLDGQQWQPAYASIDSRGDTDYVVFPARSARHVRMSSMPRTADWGVSIREFEPLSAEQSARVTGLASDVDGARLFASDGKAAAVMQARGARPGTRAVEIALPHGDEVVGAEVWWDGPRNGATLEMREGDGPWRVVAEDPGREGTLSYLASRDVRKPSALRLTTGEVDGAAPRIARLRLLGPKQVLTPTKRLEVLAARTHGELMPSSLRRQQVYWTTVGIPAGRQKALVDEYGNLEAFKGGPMLQAVWRGDDGRAATADMDPARRHALREGWMPMPSVEWTARPGITVRNDAFAAEQDGQPVVLARWRVTNTGTAPARGALSLLVRPLQVNPPWQHGGWSPVPKIALEGVGASTTVRVAGRTLLQTLTRPDARGAAAFGAHGEGEVTRFAATGTVPEAQSADDADGLAGAVMRFDVDLAPGAHRDVVAALPLGREFLDAKAGTLPEPPPIHVFGLIPADADIGTAWDAAAERVAGQWRDRFANLDITLPDASLVDRLRAQGAYMLINQTGHAMQPGPRNYNRSFIRDGAATAAILVRMGRADVARDYLRWYTDHALNPNGMVSPILNEDGSINRGFGSDIEYDSQGQYIQLVADIARLDGGPDSVREYLPAVTQAMKFLQELRERTMVPGYMGTHLAPERFHGILAPSISHEGYSSPTHSYWDDYFGIKGWHDGAWLAESLGDAKTAAWARGQERALRDSVAASIRATMAWKGSDTLPSSADLGDSDPTSVSIALDPNGAGDVLPADALRRTFDRYLEEQVRIRDVPGALYAYTPYELRNVLTYVHLDRPRDAAYLLDGFVGHQRPRAWMMWPEVVHSRERFDGYIGDMPHTWIGAEYARTIFGMLLHEGDDALVLLPGTPPAWLAGDGLRTRALPTARGPLTLAARQDGDVLTVDVGDGLSPGPVRVAWPSRTRPARVRVDGRPVDAFDAGGIVLPAPFRTLEARW